MAHARPLAGVDHSQSPCFYRLNSTGITTKYGAAGLKPLEIKNKSKQFYSVILESLNVTGMRPDLRHQSAGKFAC